MHIFWRRQWHPTPALLPGKSHGWRSLVGRSPWGRKELDTTERLHFHFSLSCTGEGNGNPLHCSCLENPRDGGAWWAAIYGVTQSWTRLRWLSSSSMHIFIILGSNLSVFYSTLEWIESLSSNDKERNNCLYSVELRTKIVNSKKYTVVLYLFCCCWKFGSELHWI